MHQTSKWVKCQFVGCANHGGASEPVPLRLPCLLLTKHQAKLTPELSWATSLLPWFACVFLGLGPWIFPRKLSVNTCKYSCKGNLHPLCFAAFRKSPLSSCDFTFGMAGVKTRAVQRFKCQNSYSIIPVHGLCFLLFTYLHGKITNSYLCDAFLRQADFLCCVRAN